MPVGQKRRSTGSSESNARGKSKARAEPVETVTGKRRHAGSVADGGMPAGGPGVIGLGRGARLNRAGEAEARTERGAGARLGVASGREARGWQVAMRGQVPRGAA